MSTIMLEMSWISANFCDEPTSKIVLSSFALIFTLCVWVTVDVVVFRFSSCMLQLTWKGVFYLTTLNIYPICTHIYLLSSGNRSESLNHFIFFGIEFHFFFGCRVGSLFMTFCFDYCVYVVPRTILFSYVRDRHAKGALSLSQHKIPSPNTVIWPVLFFFSSFIRYF